MTQHDESGPASPPELFSELESINELLERVDDDIATILAEIADEELEPDHIPVLDDIVDSGEPLPAAPDDTLDALLRTVPAMQQPAANENPHNSDAHVERAAISAVYRREQPSPGLPEFDVDSDNHDSVTFSRTDFDDLPAHQPDDTEPAIPAVVPQQTALSVDEPDPWPLHSDRATLTPVPAQASAPAANPTADLNTDALAECAAIVIAEIIDEWLPVLREELSRRLGSAISANIAEHR